MFRRPGVGLSRRSGFRGIGGAVDPRLLIFADGTFTRNSEASYLTGDGSTLAWAAVDELRYPSIAAYVSDGSGKAGLLEGSSTNELLQSEDFTTTWTLNNGSMTRTADQDTAPDGDADADDIGFTASATDMIYQDVPEAQLTDNATCPLSVWARCSSGTESIRLFIRQKDGVTQSISSDKTVTTTWQRFDFSASVGSDVSPSAVRVGIRNGTDAAARNVFLWGAQFEDNILHPTSYIRTTTAVVTRSADDLDFSTVPSRLLDGRWRVCIVPLGANDEIENVATPIGFNTAGSTNRIRYNAAADKWEAVTTGGGVHVASNTLTFARLTPLTLTLHPSAGTIEVEGADTGDGQNTGTTWTWPDGAQIGANQPLTNPFFGLITEPVPA